jgi:ABC-type branched-subunit amino acid transport system substrate-binding protein
VALVAAVAFLSACGSTVQVQGQAQLGTQDGLGTPAGGAPLDATTGGGALTPGGTTGAVTTPVGGTTGGASAGGPQSPTDVPQVGMPSGGAKAPVEIGVVIFPDVNQAAKALGGTADVGDQKAETEAAIAWVNDHGGLAGHRIKPVYFEVSLTSTQPYSVTYQQICTSFTQDHKVIAVVAIANVEPALPECLQRTRTLFFTHGHYLRSEADYAHLSNTITPEDAGSDRIARSLVSEILGGGVVKPGEKLGLLYMDYSAPVHAKEIIETAMKAKGISVVSYKIPYPQSTQDIANSASVVQSAELQMAAQGVKVVTFMCPGCVTFFTQYAESQGYYPRYVLTSLDSLLSYKGKGHARSFANAIAIGWDPIRDIGVYANPGPLAANPTFQLCRQIEKANVTQDASLYASIAICGAFQSLYQAAKANPSTVTGEGLMAGYHTLGTSFAAPSNLTTLLRRDHRDGTTGYRTMTYLASCDCFRYDNVTIRTLS